jgi:hypothetical protein
MCTFLGFSVFQGILLHLLFYLVLTKTIACFKYNSIRARVLKDLWAHVDVHILFIRPSYERKYTLLLIRL